MERVRYDLLLCINAQKLAVICNFYCLGCLLRVSACRHRVPFLGIQPSNVPLRGSLEQLATLPGTVDDRIKGRNALLRDHLYLGGCGHHPTVEDPQS